MPYSPYGASYDTNVSNAQLAYGSALARYDADRKNTLNDYGFGESGQSYSGMYNMLNSGNTAGAISQFGNRSTTLASGNPYGKFQQMFAGQGQQLLGAQDAYADRGLGRSGIAGNQYANMQTSFLGDRSNLISGLRQTLSGMDDSVIEGALNLMNYRNEQNTAKARDEEAYIAAHPEVLPPDPVAPAASTAPAVRDYSTVLSAAESHTDPEKFPQIINELEQWYMAFAGNAGEQAKIKSKIDNLMNILAARPKDFLGLPRYAGDVVNDGNYQQQIPAGPKEGAGQRRNRRVRPDPAR